MASPADVTANVVSQLVEWSKQPFRTNMNLGGWALFVGVVILTAIAWSLILHDLRGEL